MALNLQAGTVLHLWCAFCRPPKWKFHVVAYTVPTVRYLLINSHIPPLLRADPELVTHQVELRQTDNLGFLSHDSVIDCSMVMGGPTMSELEDLYAKDPGILRGRVSTPGRRAVRAVVKGSDLLNGYEIKAICAIW